MSNELPDNQVNLEAPVEEKTVEAPKEKFDGLSNRAALEEAMAIHKDGKEPEVRVNTPTSTQVTQAVNADPEPPSGFNKEEQDAWKRKDIPAIQKAYRRTYDARTVELNRAQTSEKKAREEAERERGEAKTWRELGEMAKPYIEARGQQGVTPQTAMMEALALIQEFKKGDPATVKAELKKIGIDLDKAPGQTAAPTQDPKIEALQQTVNELKRDKDERNKEKLVQTFETIFIELNSFKTRTGEPVFPGLLDKSETGIKFAQELGSLTYDPGFRALVLRRFPNANQTIFVREAYIALGGKVSGAPVRVSPQSNQEHINKSRRAAAAIPGRIAPRTSEYSNLVGKLSNRAAAAKALEIHSGE